MKREEINLRDPFVLVHDGKYYLYGTRGATCWGEADGFDCYVGTNLEEFEGPFEVFHKTEEFAPHINYWAPEVYAYEGAFYMFASFFTDGVGRGTHCLKADNPLGPFVPYSDGSITPKEWACLDGTLYVAGDGTPYMVFCHEWEQTGGDGTICAVELTKDLKAPAGEPRYLFKASDAAPAVTTFHHPRKGDIYVTDGPFLFRDGKGRLRMIWSSFSAGGYSVVLASSDNNEITGNWKPEPELLFAKDGGHGMLFTGLDGKRYLALHSPNETLLERPKFVEVTI
ncbi:MAG: glycoside hydrolase family 43 protein [Lachnospiraceae bacterium]